MIFNPKETALARPGRAVYRKGVLKRLFPVLVAAVLLPSPADAQSLQSLFDSLKPAAPAAAKPDPPVAEQVEWAKSEAAAAQALVTSENEARLAKRLEQAGLPSARIDDFRLLARDVQRASEGAIEAINGYAEVPRDQVQAALPKDEAAATAVRETLRQAEVAARASGDEVDLLRRMLGQSNAASLAAEREMREMAEERTAARDDEAKTRADVLLELASWRKRAADAAAFAIKWRLARQEALFRAETDRAASAAKALAESGFDRQFVESRATSQIAALAGQITAAEKSLEAARKARQDAVADLKALGTGDPRLAAQEAAVEALNGRVASQEGMLRFLDLERVHWQKVLELSGNPQTAALSTFADEIADNLRSIGQWRALMDRRATEARDRFDEVQRRFREARSDAAQRRTLERAAEEARLRVEALAVLATKADQISELKRDAAAEIQQILEKRSAAVRLGDLWTRVCAAAVAVWKFEIYHTAGGRITVGKILVAVLGILLAFAAARLVAGWVSAMAGKRFRVSDAQSLLLEKVIFFPLAALLVFTTLNWLSIPLGAFAFLGGALAIGIGFGAQNLMNNFISGLILLFERQVRLGDIIEVGGNTGRVTHLGSRCSRLRKFNGTEVLVPNSAFLEKDVTNWTLNDPQHRFDFTVGVEYGAPVERVMEVLAAALESEPAVLKEPKPDIFFESFGDSSLVFRLFYWIDIRASDGRLVGSNIRRAIDAGLRGVGIAIPFPQRDMNLHSTAPITVRIEK